MPEAGEGDEIGARLLDETLIETRRDVRIPKRREPDREHEQPHQREPSLHCRIVTRADDSAVAGAPGSNVETACLSQR
jgi:hypothetical protein